MTGAVRTGAARTATAERAICAGANASTEEHKASISIPSDEAICASRKFLVAQIGGSSTADDIPPVYNL